MFFTLSLFQQIEIITLKLNDMTNSELFIAAHKLTKEIIIKGDSYSATFGLCLSFLKNKPMSKETTFTGIEEGENYTLVISEVKTNFHYEKCVDIKVKFETEDEYTVQLSTFTKDVAGWMDDNLGVFENEELENILTNLF